VKHNALSISGLKNGEYDSYRALFERCYGKLLSFVNYLIKNKQAAEDIVQDQFLKLWNNRQTIDELVSVESYLYIMTKNAALNYIKVRSKLIEIPENGLPAVSSIDLDHNIDVNLVTNRLREIIDMMPEQRKRVFTMSRIDGMSTRLKDTVGISDENGDIFSMIPRRR